MRISDWSSDVCSSDLHQVKGKIGDRVTDRREFPIEDGGDLGAVRAEDEVVTAKVAMNDRNFIVVRDMSEEPFAQSVHALILPRARIGLILAFPPADLPFEITARLAIVGKATAEIGRASCRERGGQTV